MLTVGLYILQVVEAVDGTGNKAERNEHDERGPEECFFQQITTKENRCEHEPVFEPLE